MGDDKRFDLAWGILKELRAEIVESIKLNFQITALKGTFIAGALTIILGRKGDLPMWVIAIPVASMVFFDALIAVRKFVVRRNAFYIRNTLEPILREASNWPESARLWEEFLASGDYEDPYTTFPFVTKIVNWGLNLAFSVIAIAMILLDEPFMPAILSTIIIVGAFAISLYILDRAAS